MSYRERGADVVRDVVVWRRRVFRHRHVVRVAFPSHVVGGRHRATVDRRRRRRRRVKLQTTQLVLASPPTHRWLVSVRPSVRRSVCSPTRTTTRRPHRQPSDGRRSLAARSLVVR